jgi:hypothetical protein
VRQALKIPAYFTIVATVFIDDHGLGRLLILYYAVFKWFKKICAQIIQPSFIVLIVKYLYP